MSVPVKKVIDPRLDIQERVYYAKMGGANITYNEYQALSATDSQIVWSNTTPSVNVGVDRRMYVEMDFDVEYPSTVEVGNLPKFNTIMRDKNLGLRQYPLASAIETVSLKLNNSTQSSNCQDLVHALQRYGTCPDERNRYMSGTASYPDQFPSYDPEGVGVGTLGARNPFAEYSSNVEEVSRQIFNYLKPDSVVYEFAGPGDTDPRVRRFRITIREPLWAPGIVNWSERPVQCLFGIQTIDVVLSLVSDLKSAIFAGIVGLPGLAPPGSQNNFANARVTVAGSDNRSSNAKLHVLYITPQPTADQAVPSLLQYPYYEVNRYITSAAELAPADTFLVDGKAGRVFEQQVNNITLHSIPKRTYIFVRPRRSTLSTERRLATPNVFAEIVSIDINFNNRAGVLSSAKEYDLYMQSVNNGLDQAWPEWNRYQGSVLCIDSALDLPLAPLEASGSRGNYQWQYSIRYRSLLPRESAIIDPTAPQFAYDVYTVTIGEGFLTVNDAVVSLDVGVLTEDAINKADMANLSYNDLVREFRGGSFLEDVFKGVKKGAKVLAPVADVVADVAGMIPDPRAQAISMGARVGSKTAKALGGRKTGGANGWVGGDLSGGARMSKGSLARRAM